MPVDFHPYLIIYLVGCALVVVLLLFKVAVFWLVSWITKENILNKNLKKVQPPDKVGPVLKSLLFLGGLLLEALLSWINVIVAVFQIFKMALNVIREALAVKPEIIKSLRFPLWNNPNLSREAVWAHLTALQTKSGEIQPGTYDLLDSLDSITEYYPVFSKRNAVVKLKELDVIDNKVISDVIGELNVANERT